MVEKQNDQVVTARLNGVYAHEGEDSSLDPALAELQQRALKRDGHRKPSSEKPEG